MAKKSITENDNDRYPSNDDVTYKQSEEEVYKQSEDLVTLVFKQNRHKELHVAGKVYQFWGTGRLKVPRSIIEHSDFKSQEHYFIIKED